MKISYIITIVCVFMTISLSGMERKVRRDSRLRVDDLEERIRELLADNFDINARTTVHHILSGREVCKKADTLLHIAVRECNLDLVEELLAAGANVNAKDSEGQTPLHLVARRGHLGILKCLLDNQADVNAIANNSQTALHVASRYGQLGVARWLLVNRARPSLSDGSYYTPLDHARSGGYQDIVNELNRYHAQSGPCCILI